MWLQISAGQGPAECAWVVAQLAAYLQQAAKKYPVDFEILQSEAGPEKGTCKSVLIALKGQNSQAFLQEWQGSIQWIGPSPFRPHHKRKNWFVGVQGFEEIQETQWQSQELKIETMRSSGPGGQHTNKTESAVRITHLPTGISVHAREERSQHQNRKLALARLYQALQAEHQQVQEEQQQTRWQAHHQLERGNAKWVFRGVNFQLSST